MVDFVLDNLGSPAGEGLDAGLKLLILPLDLDGLEPLTGARTAQQGQTALLRIVGTGSFDDLGVKHNHICPLVIKGNDALAYADHIGRHTHAGSFIGCQRIQQIPGNLQIIHSCRLGLSRQQNWVVYHFFYHPILPRTPNVPSHKTEVYCHSNAMMRSIP